MANSPVGVFLLAMRRAQFEQCLIWLALDAERTLRRPIGLPQQKSAQACMIARRRSKLSVRR